MHQALTQKLYDEFPELYRGNGKSIQESCMHWGFAHDDGWFMIIYDLSVDIMDTCRKDNIDTPEVVQVKEKMGGLRYYIHGGNTVIQDLIYRAEDASCKTCEVCGEPGYMRREGWVRTLCDAHANKR